MSEYGCITNTRKFTETVALYQTDMTTSFSGGLVYEYSEEANGYGLVTIDGTTVTDYDNEFAYLKAALANVTDPTDGGNFTTSTVVQDCPPQSDDWDTSPFIGSALPATPSGALKYFVDGAGAGPGLDGAGSQDASGGSSSTASADAGEISTTYTGTTGATSATSSSSSTSSSDSSSAAGRVGSFGMAPIVCGAVVAVSFGLGAALL